MSEQLPVVNDCLFQMQEAAKQLAAEVERLRAEKDAVKVAAWDESAALLAERNALRAEVERLRADAERYRWIKAQGHKNGPFYFSATGQVPHDQLDAAIDAARGRG